MNHALADQASSCTAGSLSLRSVAVTEALLVLLIAAEQQLVAPRPTLPKQRKQATVRSLGRLVGFVIPCEK